MMRYSLSSGEVQHVIVGNFDELSLGMLRRLFKFGGHHDYEHEALQISLGGQVALRGWQCREFLEDEDAQSDETLKRGDTNIIAAVVNSIDTEFRLRVFEDYEERIILTEALEDLDHDSVNLKESLEARTEEMRKAYSEYFTNRSRADLLKEKIRKAS